MPGLLLIRRVCQENKSLQQQQRHSLSPPPAPLCLANLLLLFLLLSLLLPPPDPLHTLSIIIKHTACVAALRPANWAPNQWRSSGHLPKQSSRHSRAHCTALRMNCILVIQLAIESHTHTHSCCL